MRAYKRIKKIAEAVLSICNNECVVADIATDHGYLAEILNRSEKVKTIYATDISKKCLQKVVDLKKDFNLSKVETVLGDGLEPLKSVDIAVIAGVGGLEIIKMLTKQNMQETGENKCNLFVLQPAQNVFEFRKWLFDNNICVISDCFVEDAGKFYPIIVVDVSKYQNNEKTLFNLFIGRDNNQNSLEFERFLDFYIDKFDFLNKFEIEKIKKDRILSEKYEIYCLLKSLKK